MNKRLIFYEDEHLHSADVAMWIRWTLLLLPLGHARPAPPYGVPASPQAACMYARGEHMFDSCSIYFVE